MRIFQFQYLQGLVCVIFFGLFFLNLLLQSYLTDSPCKFILKMYPRETITVRIVNSAIADITSQVASAAGQIVAACRLTRLCSDSGSLKRPSDGCQIG